MNQSRMIRVCAFAVFLVCSLTAQEKTKMPSGVQGSFLKLQGNLEKESVSLAGAIPQDKYSWRPMEGVRSISEAFMHMALGNYLVMQLIGVKVPDGIDLKTFQTSLTEKDKVIDALKASFVFVDEQVARIPDSDLDREIDFFGNKLTVRDAIVAAANHEHEVLGQAIAYARMNHIVPPWTAEREAKTKARKEKGGL